MKTTVETTTDSSFIQPRPSSTAPRCAGSAGLWEFFVALRQEVLPRTILLPQDVRADLDDKQADRISNEGEIVKALRLPGTTD